MVADFEVRGVDDFLRLSKALKQAGDKELRKALHKGMQQATKPLQTKAARELSAALPGPLKARGAAVKQVAKVKTGRDPGVTVGVQYGRRGRGLGASNARMVNRTGQVRHPVFGNRERWANTRVGGQGWFDRTYERGASEIRGELEQVMEDVAEQVVRRAKG